MRVKFCLQKFAFLAIPTSDKFFELTSWNHKNGQLRLGQAAAKLIFSVFFGLDNRSGHFMVFDCSCFFIVNHIQFCWRSLTRRSASFYLFRNNRDRLREKMKVARCWLQIFSSACLRASLEIVLFKVMSRIGNLNYHTCNVLVYILTENLENFQSSFFREYDF